MLLNSNVHISARTNIVFIGFFRKDYVTEETHGTKKPPIWWYKFLWRIPESNRSPLACHASALPNELIPQFISNHLPHLPECFRDALPNELIPLEQI